MKRSRMKRKIKPYMLTFRAILKRIKLRNVLIIIIVLLAEAVIVLWPAICSVHHQGFEAIWNSPFTEPLFGLSGTALSIGFQSGLAAALFFMVLNGFNTGLVAGAVFEMAIGLALIPVNTFIRELILGPSAVINFGIKFEIITIISTLFIGVLPIGLIFGTAIGFIFGLTTENFKTPKRGLAMGLVFGSFYGIVSEIIHLIIHKPLFGLINGISFIIIVEAFQFPGFIIGMLVKRWASPIIRSFRLTILGFSDPDPVKSYSFIFSVVSFILVYILVVLVFSLWFYACYLEGTPEQPFFSTGKISYPIWWDFIYFSFVTITTLGYGDIFPIRPFPQLLVVLESTIGVMIPAIFIGIILNVAGKMAELQKAKSSDKNDS